MKNLENESEKNNELHRLVVKNSIYSLVNNYGILIFQIIVSILLARLISQDLWGYLIIASSYIGIISIILTFFPPALGLSLNYYIPKYIALNQYNKLKSIIKNAILVKILFTAIICIISLFIFSIFTDLFMLNLKNHTNLFFILFPLILINGLGSILLSIYQAFFKFKLLFELTLIRYFFNILTLLLCFLLKEIHIELIAIITLFSNLIPFGLNCIIFSNLYLKIKTTQEKKNLMKEDLHKITSYGTPLSIGILLNDIWKQMEIQIIGIIETPYLVTGYSISKNYSLIPLTATASFSNPLITTFSLLDVKNQHKQINQIYNIVFKYSLFFLLLITGTLFFLPEFFLSLVYGESFLSFSIILKLNLISIIFTSLGNILLPLLNAKNKVKIFPINVAFNILIIIPFFLTGLLLYGIIGMLFGLIIAKFLIFLIQILISIKIGKIKMNIYKIFFLYFFFFIALIITLILDFSIFKDFSFRIPLVIFTFLLIYLTLTLLFRIFSYNELLFLEEIFNSKKKYNIIIRKLLKFLKKIIRE